MLKFKSKLNHLFCILFLTILFSHYVKGQSNKVSPKLDFDEADDRNNGSVTIMPGTAGGRGGYNSDADNRDTVVRNRDGHGNKDSEGHRGDDKSGPKIHGVRVTVDTGDAQKSKESKESVETTDTHAGPKQKKRVGIHTDITFEITADGDVEVNSTNPAQGDKEDASVPIFKGRAGSNNQKPRKSYDGKSYWSPNYSDERHGYEVTYRHSDNTPGHGSYYPGNTYNVPVYTSGGSEGALGSTTVHRRHDGWNSYTPSQGVYWTTERSPTENLRPNVLTAYRSPTWKPCYCVTTYTESRKRRESKPLIEPKGKLNE